jgi:hypothetical protein
VFRPILIHILLSSTSLAPGRHGPRARQRRLQPTSLFHRPSLLVATPPPELPPRHNRRACKDGGGGALAHFSWSGRCGGEVDLAWDDRVVVGRWCLSRSGQEHLATAIAAVTAARGGPVGSTVSGGGWWWSRSPDPSVWSWSIGGGWIPSSLAQALPSSPPCGGTASSRWSSGRSSSPWRWCGARLTVLGRCRLGSFL